MDLLAHALRPSGSTHGRPPYSSLLSPGDMLPMVPDLVRTPSANMLGSCTPGTAGHRLRPGSLQWQTAGEPSPLY
jgi:hypothetical protein